MNRNILAVIPFPFDFLSIYRWSPSRHIALTQHWFNVWGRINVDSMLSQRWVPARQVKQVRILDFLIGVQIFIEGRGDSLTLSDNFSENSSWKWNNFSSKRTPWIPLDPPLIRRVYVMVKYAEGEGVGRRGVWYIFVGGGKGANFVFRVMGVFHLIGSIFQIPILCVLRLRRYVCVCVGGGGVKIGLLLFESF